MGIKALMCVHLALGHNVEGGKIRVKVKGGHYTICVCDCDCDGVRVRVRDNYND